MGGIPFVLFRKNASERVGERMGENTFFETVYSIVKEIPAGSVITYGQIANLMGAPQCSRRVGQAMFHTPSEYIPAHRVVNSQGRLVPGWEEQRELLEKEGVAFKKNGCVDLNVSLWNPPDFL